MTPAIIDRDSFLQNLRISKLLTNQQFRLVIDKLGHLQDTREIAKALASWKLVTKFQAKMLLMGRNTGFFLGPYRILDQLGQGGMGRVYKAMHQTMNRLVALKVLAPQLVTTERARELFLREVQAAAQLSHPNIVMAFDANENEGRHYLAMEYVAGPNLERYVKKQGPLSIGLACEIVFQVANGLQHAHDKGMVHRDIKPANILLHQEPGSDRIQVKILDFGLARLQQTEKQGAKTIIARDNTVMGTPDFLSPEQSKNLHETDIRSDLYSLGCTFYYLLTGQVPYPGGNTVDKVIRHNTDQAPAIEELCPTVPKAVAAIVRKLMAKKPADRFRTPDELMDALAPHAAPSVADWPLAAPATGERTSQEEIALAEEIQVDTEPRAQGSTEISDHDSILEWADATRKQRQVRRRIISVAVVLLGILALAVAGVVGWVIAQQP
ncbi:MAG: serine/threonine protein kinase [Planctomycetes bacterium]|nr:serine/threonine protein kinase [Planctomycetota bacterium]